MKNWRVYRWGCWRRLRLEFEFPYWSKWLGLYWRELRSELGSGYKKGSRSGWVSALRWPSPWVGELERMKLCRLGLA